MTRSVESKTRVEEVASHEIRFRERIARESGSGGREIHGQFAVLIESFHGGLR